MTRDVCNHGCVGHAIGQRIKARATIEPEADNRMEMTN